MEKRKAPSILQAEDADEQLPEEAINLKQLEESSESTIFNQIIKGN